jgi:predicted nucleic acid-binding Zn ribbon protein
MPSDFKSCRACGEPVYAGAKRCPNCHALTLWRNRLRSKTFSLLTLALVALAIIGVLLYGWPNETTSEATTGTGASNRPQAPGVPATPVAADELPQPQLSGRPRTAQGAAGAGAAHTVAALQQRNSEQTDSVTVRGERIEPGMSADRLFELVSKHDLLGQTMEPDPFNPPNLQFVKYYRVDNEEFSVELRKASRDAPYGVTSVRVARLADRAGTTR